MKVIEAMKKYKLTESRMRIYDASKKDEVVGTRMSAYFYSDVVRIYPHNGDAVIEVKG